MEAERLAKLADYDSRFQYDSDYYVEQSVPAGGGANVVNVILVDFRGFDTFGEMTVIGIAALAIHAMLSSMFQGPLMGKLAGWKSELRKSPNRHPVIMVVITRMMLPLALMVAVFILFAAINYLAAASSALWSSQ